MKIWLLESAVRAHRSAQRQDAHLLGLGLDADVESLTCEIKAAGADDFRILGVNDHQGRSPLAIGDVECDTAAVHIDRLVANDQQFNDLASIEAAERVDKIRDPALRNRQLDAAAGLRSRIRDRIPRAFELQRAA